MMGVEYYEQVVEKMGASTADFARFVHGAGDVSLRRGVGTSVFDAPRRC